PVLPLGAERRIAARVVVAPEERARLLVVPSARRHPEGLPEVLLELALDGPALDVPGVVVRAEPEARDRLERLDVEVPAHREPLTHAVLGLVLLRFQALAEDDAAVRVRLKAVQDLRGVDELGHEDRRPRLRPRALEAVDPEVARRPQRIAREAALRVLERVPARRRVVRALHAVADPVEVSRVADLELRVVAVGVGLRGDA